MADELFRAAHLRFTPVVAKRVSLTRGNPQFCPKFEYRRTAPCFYSHFGAGHKGIKPLMCKHNVV